MNLKKSMSLFAAASLLVIAAGCGGGAKPAPAPAGEGGAKGGAAPAAAAGDVAKGKEVFSGTCASCHGADAKGLAGLGKNLADKDPWIKQISDADLVEFIKKGRPTSDPMNTRGVDMPPKGGNPSLTDEDFVNVVAYIRDLQKTGKDLPAASDKNPSQK